MAATVDQHVKEMSAATHGPRGLEIIAHIHRTEEYSSVTDAHVLALANVNPQLIRALDEPGTVKETPQENGPWACRKITWHAGRTGPAVGNSSSPTDGFRFFFSHVLPCLA